MASENSSPHFTNTSPINETIAPAATPPTPFERPWVALLALLGIGLAAPLVPLPSPLAALIGGAALTFGYVWLVLRFVNGVTRQRMPLPLIVAWGVFALLEWGASEFWVRPYLQSTFIGFGAHIPAEWRYVGLLNFNVRPLLLMSAAVCLGAALSRIVRHANMIGPLCGVTALIDIWGVLFGGIVSHLMTSPTTQHVAQKAMANLPQLGASSGGYALPLPAVGVGDFLFLGLFFGVLHAHQLNARGALNWVWPLISLTLLAVPFLGPLPGLLPIGLGVAIPNRRYFRFTREESFALLWAGLMVVALTAFLYFLIVSRLKPA